MGHESACIFVSDNVADTMDPVQIRLATKEKE